MGEIVQAGEPRSARLESIRAIAALAVLGSHVFAYAHGWAPTIFQGFLHRSIMGGGLGVQLFFALSGYLLYRAFVRRDFGQGAPVDLRTYGRNRALRILPLYYAAVVTLLLLTQRGGSGDQWWRFLLFAEEFSTRTAQTVDAPLWSLVVELHFYLLLPLLAWGLARVSRRSTGRAAAVLLAIGGASMALRHIALTPAVIWAYSLPVTFYGFVPGMLLALLHERWGGRRPPWMTGLAASSDVWVGASVTLWILLFWRYSLVDLTAPASFLLLGACVLPLGGTRLVRLLDWRPLALVGVISYSLYVWHVPIIEHLLPHAPKGTLGLLVVALPSSLAAAAGSYWLIERPFLRFRRPWAAGPDRGAAGRVSESTRAVILVLVALVVRLAVVLRSPRLPLSSDPADYNRLGRLLAAGHGFGPSLLSPSGGPTTFRAPLYPLFLAGVYRLSANSIQAARCLQAVLGVATVVLIGLIGSRLWGRRVGWIAAGLAALFPPLIITGGALLSESIYVPVELGAFLVVLVAVGDGRRRWPWVAAGGALAGLGVLARPNGIALLIALAALLVARAGADRGRVLVLVAGFAMVVAPWIVRDAMEFHRLVPITDIDGYNLAGVYNTQAASSAYPTHYQWRPPVAVPSLRPLFHDPSLDEVALGDRLRDRGLSWIGAHPTSVLAAIFWDSWRMAELTGIRESSAVVAEAGFGRGAAWLEMVSFWSLGLLAVLGMVTRRAREAWVVWVAPVSLWAVTVPFLGTSRLRAPLDPFVVLAAAIALVTLVDRMQARRTSAPPAGGLPPTSRAVGAGRLPPRGTAGVGGGAHP